MFQNKTQHESGQVLTEENGPSNTRIILNDDCIGEIFRRVTNLKDFLNMTQVCRQFAESARQCVRGNCRKELVIADHDDNSLSVRDARRSGLLQKFGHLVDSIVWFGKEHNDEYRTYSDDDDDNIDTDIDTHNDGELLRQEDDGFIFEAILKNCENLKILDLVNIRFDHFGYHVENGSVFGSLEEIRLSGNEIYHREEIIWLMTNFPQLKKVRLSQMGIEHNDLIGFLQLNPQIRSMELFDCYHLNIAAPFRKKISEQFPNIELSYFFCRNGVQIYNLQKLTSLCIIYDGIILVRELLDCFVINNVPLNHLKVYGDAGDDISNSLSGLTLLKSLNLMKMSNAMLLQLLTDLHNLERITVRDAKSITVSGLTQALQYGRNLKLMDLYEFVDTLDLDVYNSILALARERRFQIKLSTYSEINVPKEMLEANRQWIKFGWF